MLYFCIIRVSEKPGKGWFELHNSIRKKELTSGRPDCCAKAIRYYDKGSYYVAVETIQAWRHEMKDRFSAKEVDPPKQVYPATHSRW